MGKIEVGGHLGAPRPGPLVGQRRARRGTEVIPEVDEPVLQLPHRLAADPNVRVAPLVGERITDVVAPHEANLAVHHQDLAVVLAGTANVEREQARTQRREATHVQVPHPRETIKRTILVQDPEAIPHAKDLYPACRRVNEGVLEALPPPVRAPDEGLEVNVVLRPRDGLQHVLVQGGSLRVRARHGLTDPRVRGGKRGETVHAAGDAGRAHPVDRVHRDNRSRLRGRHRDPHLLEDRPRLPGELTSL